MTVYGCNCKPVITVMLKNQHKTNQQEEVKNNFLEPPFADKK
jgi:hypothetical protein